MDKLDQTKRYELIKKIDDSPQKNYEPTEKEIENAYGYLDYCFNCGLRIYPGELMSHCAAGNYHKLGCFFSARMIGAALNTLKLIILKRVLSREKCGGW